MRKIWEMLQEWLALFLTISTIPWSFLVANWHMPFLEESRDSCYLKVLYSWPKLYWLNQNHEILISKHSKPIITHLNPNSNPKPQEFLLVPGITGKITTSSWPVFHSTPSSTASQPWTPRQNLGPPRPLKPIVTWRTPHFRKPPLTYLPKEKNVPPCCRITTSPHQIGRQKRKDSNPLKKMICLSLGSEISSINLKDLYMKNPSSYQTYLQYVYAYYTCYTYDIMYTV